MMLGPSADRHGNAAGGSVCTRWASVDGAQKAEMMSFILFPPQRSSVILPLEYDCRTKCSHVWFSKMIEIERRFYDFWNVNTTFRSQIVRS